MFYPIDTATRRPIAPMEVPTWATYSELKKEIERLNLPAAAYEKAIRELCQALNL
jgi:hypothetical protein